MKRLTSNVLGAKAMVKDRPTHKSLMLLNYLFLGIIFFLIFGPWFQISNTLNSIITMLSAFAFMLIHGYLAWGTRNILVFLVITWICSFTFEAIGVATGMVFGQYYYTDHLGPKILDVPLMIQVSYAATGYASIMVARLILGIQRPFSKLSLFFTTLIAALLMVGWDVCLDPYESTVDGDWIWPQGGYYFGIGIQNFIGWFVTVFIFMFLYHLYASFFPEKHKTEYTKSFCSQSLIYYAIMALNIILVPWVGGVGPMASPDNYQGSLDDLIYSLSLITVFIMGTPCIIAVARLGVKT